jgi:hypothetical protein
MGLVSLTWWCMSRTRFLAHPAEYFGPLWACDCMHVSSFSDVLALGEPMEPIPVALLVPAEPEMPMIATGPVFPPLMLRLVFVLLLQVLDGPEMVGPPSSMLVFPSPSPVPVFSLS